MKSIIERKIVPEYQTIYKYVSDDGKFMSESQYEVERYEKEQQKPYIEEYKKKLAELHDWVTENESHLYTGKKYSGTLDQMVLYLLFLLLVQILLLVVLLVLVPHNMKPLHYLTY